ncbi:MAG: dienelactone hydrolase family protein [Bdellovibrionia bacterium]
MTKLLSFMAALVATGLLHTAHAAIKTETVKYKEGKTELTGYVAYDDSIKGPRPVVLIIHQWMGLSANEKMRAEMLAKEGYLAFAVDIYGAADTPKDISQAGNSAGKYKKDVALFRKRIKAGMDAIAKNPNANIKSAVVAGYCFGGTGALEAARANLPVVGAVSFHGGLSTPKPQDTKSIKSKVLVLHGAIDPYVPAAEVDGFMKEMNDAKADYQFISYSGAVHAFTQKEAGNDPSQGAAYQEAADKRSWIAFMNFLNEVAPVTK